MQPIIFGGEFMSQIDLCAAQCIRRCLFFNDSPCKHAVTHQMNFTFLAPCYVGDNLELRAQITEVRKKSIAGTVTAFRLNVEAEEKNDTAWEKVGVAQFVFITVGDLIDLQNKPKFLPYKEHGLPATEKQ